jgi:hypothetical protein
MVALAVPLFSHRLVSGPRLTANGTTLLTLHPLGYVAGLVPLLYLAWALVVFLAHRRRPFAPLMAGSLLLLVVGPLAGL